MFRKNRIFFCFIPILFLVCMIGCGGGTPAPSPPATPKGPSAEKDKPGPVKMAEQKEPGNKIEPEYSYDPTGKPDPFKPFIQLTPVKEASRRTPVTPLQRYEISQLKLVAIMVTPEGNVALVEDSAGKGFFVKKGTEIGNNDGRVTQVLKDRVIVEERYQDVLGQTKSAEVSLLLHQLEEGTEP